MASAFVVLVVALPAQALSSVLDPVVNAPAGVFKGVYVSANNAYADKIFAA